MLLLIMFQTLKTHHVFMSHHSDTMLLGNKPTRFVKICWLNADFQNLYPENTVNEKNTILGARSLLWPTRGSWWDQQWGGLACSPGSWARWALARGALGSMQDAAASPNLTAVLNPIQVGSDRLTVGYEWRFQAWYDWVTKQSLKILQSGS